MGNSVFADKMGIFHKNSGGSGKAFPDVCLSPPPPPTGPMPVPYPNSLMASDLTKGSKSVKFQGAEGALENASEVATSTGDEAGTQGGNVVTHKTKGKGFFMAWSFFVKVEGKGICRHMDPMGQNSASAPMGAADMMATVNQAVQEVYNPEKPCSKPYKADEQRKSIVKAQYDKVAAGPCWTCGSTSPMGNGPNGSPLPAGSRNFTPDHEPPAFVRWYAGGCHMTDEEWKRDFQDSNTVFPHCKQCSDDQGRRTARFSAELAERHARLIADAAERAKAMFMSGLR